MIESKLLTFDSSRQAVAALVNVEIKYWTIGPY